MSEVKVTTLNGSVATLNHAAVEELAARVRGKLLLEGDAGYDEARRIWNAMIDRRPALIVQCLGAADVMAAVNFARDHEILVSVRGGGHNIAGNAVCDGGLMIDLSQMRLVTVDPEGRRARVGPGATLGDVDHETQAFGLATPLGINSTTGVAGLTLGGGFGWLSPKYGMAIDNLLSVDIVTADGKMRRASADENADLFWAVRGGGGNYGVITSFEFQLHPVGPQVLAGMIVYPIDQARAVLRQYRDFVGSMPDHMSVWAVMRKAPPLPFLPAEVHGKEILALAAFYAGEAGEGESRIEPLRRFGTPLGEHVGWQPYTAWQQVLDPLLAAGARNYWKSHNFREFPDGLIDVLVEYAMKLPSPHCEVACALLGGEAGRISADSTAYPHRDARFVLNLHGRWETPAEDEAGIKWARDCFSAAAPYATGGVYVNFLTQEETDRVATAYGPNYGRMLELKNKYDPKNLFRLNQNIVPATDRASVLA